MENFWICFVSLFVAIDAFGSLPVFIALTGSLEERAVRHVVLQSVITAALVALAFVLVGKGFMGLIGITYADFMVAGGTLLFILSISNIVASERTETAADFDIVGAVPIGVPLVVGPAVFAALVLLVQKYGLGTTILALLLNIVFTGGVFLAARPINTLLGKAGSKTLSKVSSLLLAAFGVMLIRQGIMELIQQVRG